MKRFYALFTALAVLMAFNVNAQSGGETCASSVTLAFPALAVTGTTAGAADDYNEDCEGYGVDPDGADVVYDFTVPATGFYDFTLCQAGTAYDTKFYIYEGSCPAPGTGMTGMTVGCDDDNCDGSAPQPWSSFMFNVLLNAGTTYYLVIDGYIAGEEGTYVLSFAPASTPPTGNDMSLDNALSYVYSQIPEFNLTASTFAAAVTNTGANPGTAVTVSFTALGPNVFDGSLVDHSDASAPMTIAIGATEVVTGASAWTPSDTGVYVLEYVISSSSADDDGTNDTIFQFLNVTEDVQSRDYSIFGAALSATKLLYESADSEYGIVQDVNVDADLTGASFLLSADPAFLGQVVTGTVYSVGTDIDDLTVVATGVSGDLADTAQLVYDVPLSGSLPVGQYVLAYKGNQFVVQTVAGIYAQGSSDLVRDPVTTGGAWGFFAGPYAWSMDMNMTEAGGACDPSSTPTNLSAAVSGPLLSLSWDELPLSVGCQVNYGPNPGPFVGNQNILGFEVNSANVPTAIIPSGNWKVRTRCACSVSPIVVSGYSNTATFSIPAPRVGAEIATTVFPNPAVDQLFVNFNGEAANIQIRVVSLLGEVMSSSLTETVEGFNTVSLDVSNLTDGVYFVEIGEEVIEFTVAR